MCSTVNRHVFAIGIHSLLLSNFRRSFSSSLKSSLHHRKCAALKSSFSNNGNCCCTGTISNNVNLLGVTSGGRNGLWPVLLHTRKFGARYCLSHHVNSMNRSYSIGSQQPKKIEDTVKESTSDAACMSDPRSAKIEPEKVSATTIADKEEPCNAPKLTLYQRFKQMYKEYWYVLVPVHLATSAVWFGGFYYLAVSGVDVVHLLEIIGVPDSWIEPLKSSKAGGLVSAYTMYKVATPARYTVTLGGTTVSINYLKKWGWIKPIPSKEKLKEMYQEKKAVYQDRLQERKFGIKKTVIETKAEIKRSTDEMKQNYLEVKEGLQRSVAETQDGFKRGVTEAKKEWKHVGGIVKSATTQIFDISKKKEEK